MKIFSMNDCDWMAAETLEEATAVYLRDFGGGLDADEALDQPHEVSEAGMDRLRFHDDDAETPEDYRTFRQELQVRMARGDKFPCFFASTEY